MLQQYLRNKSALVQFHRRINTPTVLFSSGLINTVLGCIFGFVAGVVREVGCERGGWSQGSVQGMVVGFRALQRSAVYYGLYTYTAERRDVLGCTSPTTRRFPEALEMSRGRNFEVGGDTTQFIPI